MMKSGKLILVRHGLSVYNDQNRFTGWKDVDLNEQGVAEAKQAVDLLKDIDFNMAFTSKLKRASDTLDIILKGINQTFIPVEKNLSTSTDIFSANVSDAGQRVLSFLSFSSNSLSY